MSDVYKSIELVGVSDRSFSDAVRKAVDRASQSMRNLQWFEVVEERGNIEGAEIRQYQVKVRVWFGLEDGGQG